MDRSELGAVHTNEDGIFYITVNGGGLLTLNYDKSGYLPLQRKANVSWLDYEALPDVVLVPLDSQVNTVKLGTGSGMQTARGSVITDTDGMRQATLLFAENTQAQMVLPGGVTQTLITLNVRASEYTVGSQGRLAMPGDLPPNTAYTYAVEFSVDEALAAGATDVRFSQPVVTYLENFLGFPVGGIVPAGYYDRSRGVWMPAPNGQVVQITSIVDGRANLDLDGRKKTSSLADLRVLGITDAELTSLARLYAPGDTLWRIPVSHFSAWDFNWPFGPPEGAAPPRMPTPPPDHVDDPNCQRGSIIECENQVLGEVVGVTGTDFALHYSSGRVPGHKDAYTIQIPLSGSDIPTGTTRIDLEVFVAGQQFTKSFSPTVNLKTNFTWDGKDGEGQQVTGIQQAKVRVGYAYPGVYLQPSQRPGAEYEDIFGHFSFYGVPVSGNRQRNEVTLWQEWQAIVGAPSSPSAGLGSWSLDVHHSYDPHQRLLIVGTGRVRSAQTLGRTITTVAGNGVRGSSGDGGPATLARLNIPTGIAVGPDGSFYIADSYSHRVRRVSPEGIIITFAGNGNWSFGGDGGPATAAS
ncbi:MAG TPA: hypothetical protein VGE04_00535, partial [Chloroflexia bacterium]